VSNIGSDTVTRSDPTKIADLVRQWPVSKSGGRLLGSEVHSRSIYAARGCYSITSTPAYLSLRSTSWRTAIHGQSIRSSSVSLLQTPFIRHWFEKQTFSSAAPLSWNSFSAFVLDNYSVATLKSKLKAHLFTIVYTDCNLQVYCQRLWSDSTPQ